MPSVESRDIDVRQREKIATSVYSRAETSEAAVRWEISSTASLELIQCLNIFLIIPNNVFISLFEIIISAKILF